ncbi:MAG: DUF1540 domain-containing protein [Bacilli bacterium]
MPDVRCSVANCQFWGSGNFCQASQVVVHSENDNANAYQTESMTNAVLDSGLTSSASTSYETCCQTFIPRENNNY